MYVSVYVYAIFYTYIDFTFEKSMNIYLKKQKESTDQLCCQVKSQIWHLHLHISLYTRGLWQSLHHTKINP